MEDRITLEGKKYISSKRAAQLGGYTKDYIGQMCRSGKLNAKLLGRNWYILEESLASHKGKKKNTNNVLDKTNISYTKEVSTYKVMVDDRPLNPTPTKNGRITTIRAPKKSAAVSSYKVVTRTPKEKRKLPILKMAIVIGLLLAITSTIFTEGKIVYNTASNNLFAGVEFIELNRVISEINAIISR